MRLSKIHFSTLFLILIGSVSPVSSQESGSLSQKLLLEGTIQQRVTHAISKILDESQFVVDVAIELGAGPRSQVETVLRTPDGRLIRGNALRGGARPGRIVTNPFPIPGFPERAIEPSEPVRALDEETEAALASGSSPQDRSGAAVELAELTAGEVANLPLIRSMTINIILEDGVSPQIIENVRQVTLIASRFDRDRGDELSITTASFKDRRGGTLGLGAGRLVRGAAQGDQTEALRETLREAEGRNTALMEEARQRELEYLERSEEERRQALSDLADVQNERAKDLIFLQQQREEQNAKLQDALLNQIDELRKELTSGRLSSDEQDIKSIQATSLQDSLQAMRQAFEEEKERLQAQIEAALNRGPPPSRGLGGLWADNQGVFILAGLALLAVLVIAVVLIVTSRSRNPQAAMGVAYPGGMPPPYPRRRPMRPRRPVQKGKQVEQASKDETAQPLKEAPVTADEAPAKPEGASDQAGDEQEVLRQDVNAIRQSVVSMSVGRQATATRILKDWLEQGDQTPTGEEGEEGTAETSEALREEERSKNE
ncbi:MAG: hypothetical protein IID14_03710 [Candidatus Marinimicrobia bacterium]|nr:hypothetical protein [Candidatus Neomarinimicrobiota bacterium]